MTFIFQFQPAALTKHLVHFNSSNNTQPLAIDDNTQPLTIDGNNVVNDASDPQRDELAQSAPNEEMKHNDGSSEKHVKMVELRAPFGDN